MSDSCGYLEEVTFLNQRAFMNQAAMQNQYLQGIGQFMGQGCQQANVPPPYPGSNLTASKPKEKSMFKEVSADIKSFILEHRAVIYFILFALLLDNLVFKGAFKARLQAMADKVVTKVEEKIK